MARVTVSPSPPQIILPDNTLFTPSKALIVGMSTLTDREINELLDSVEIKITYLASFTSL